jgi:hypothetical protein
MKRIQIAMTILALATVLLTNAEAGDKRVGGIIIGGGTGAIFGQAIGHTTQSTIIGATVGSVAGLLIGNELQRQHAPVYHPTQITVSPNNYGNHRYNSPQPVFRDRHKSYRENCRKIVTIKNDHHRTKRVVTTICENNRGNGHRYR